MSSQIPSAGHAKAAGIRLIAGNGEYVWADEETGDLIARQSPGREWDTWELHTEEEQGEEFVYLVSPTGHFLSERGEDRQVRVDRAAPRATERFSLVPLDGDHHGHARGVEDSDPEKGKFGDTSASLLAIRSPDGQFLGLEPGSDRLVASAEAPSWETAFAVEWVTEEVVPPEVGGRSVVAPETLSVTGVHATVLPTGNVLYFSYVHAALENNIDAGLCQLWNPNTGPVTGSMDTGRNMFCSGHCWLGDGRLLVAAGQSNNWPVPGSPWPGIWGADHDLHTFDIGSSAWSRHPDMPAARYYPTVTTLPDGNAFIASGAAVRGLGSNVPNDDYEIFDYRASRAGPKLRFRPLNTDFLKHAEYPFVHLLHDGSPHGLLFVFSWNEARLFDLAAGTFREQSYKPQSSDLRTYPHQGACVLLPLRVDAPKRAKIMVLGGSQGEGDSPASNSAEIFEFDGDNPNASHWRPPQGGGMHAGRFMSDAVLLPDESVLVTNGAGRGSADKSFEPVYTVEIFDTREERWTAGAQINRPRLYHSTAVLLADGRVAIAGNTESFNPGNPVEDRTVELYSPPYLFRGARPVIASAPEIVPFGQDFRIGTPDPTAIVGAALLRAGSVTHTNDMNQRHLILPIKQREPQAIIVAAPPSGTVAPPGPYLLFLLNDRRVPSIGRFVHVREAVRNAAYVSQTVPPEVTVGAQFPVAVVMRNTGTLTWTRAERYRLGSQSPEDNNIWGISRVDLPTEVGPGATVSIAFTVTAPSTPGTYAFQWRMMQEAVEWFGLASAPMRVVVGSADENPECPNLRAEIEGINEQILDLQSQLTGNPKVDILINRQIRMLTLRAGTLYARGNELGCLIPIGPHRH